MFLQSCGSHIVCSLFCATGQRHSQASEEWIESTMLKSRFTTLKIPCGSSGDQSREDLVCSVRVEGKGEMRRDRPRYRTRPVRRCLNTFDYSADIVSQARRCTRLLLGQHSSRRLNTLAAAAAAAAASLFPSQEREDMQLLASPRPHTDSHQNLYLEDPQNAHDNTVYLLVLKLINKCISLSDITRARPSNLYYDDFA